jgi:hypothetical protein
MGAVVPLNRGGFNKHLQILVVSAVLVDHRYAAVRKYFVIFHPCPVPA